MPRAPVRALARELEFQKSDYAAAAEAYARVAQASQDRHAQARARQSQAGCLLKAGQKAKALAQLADLAADPGLRNAISVQGTLIVPNAQLVSERVINWTLSDRLRRIELPVGVNYGASPKDVIAVLEAVARAHPHQ